ncbi:MAG: helix-turn-helix domain-containing protein [Lachnospiraceae bacterium]|nr:helix-turn-helix domain-containing protein [Lachnospiraceae bacterium]
MDIKEIRSISGLSQSKFAEIYKIPKRSIENWESGARKCPSYVEFLLERAVKEDFPEKQGG